MNWIGFARLIREIYGRGLPDVDRIQRMGLLAVKIGQVHALRIDLLNEEKCRHLALLYRQNQQVSPSRLDEILQKQTVAGFREQFSGLEDQPFAVASIGQAHLGTLRGGRRVVVKVVKADYRQNFMRDIASLKRLFRTLMFVYPKLRRVANPMGLIADIEEYTLSELDLVNEMNGQRELMDVYEKALPGMDLSRLRFPVIYREMSNRDVMVSEYVEGRTFDELLAGNRLEYDMLLDLFQIHGYGMFVAGKFHGDMHPGNIILKDGNYYFIDTGYIGSVGDKIRRNLFNFFDSLSAYDYDSCASFLHGMSEKPLEEAAYKKFSAQFLALYRDFKGKTVSQVSLTRQMMNTIKLGVHSGMEFGQGVFPVIRSLMYLDGMVLRCRPDAVLLADMRPYIGKFRRLDGVSR